MCGAWAATVGTLAGLVFPRTVLSPCLDRFAGVVFSERACRAPSDAGDPWLEAGVEPLAFLVHWTIEDAFAPDFDGRESTFKVILTTSVASPYFAFAESWLRSSCTRITCDRDRFRALEFVGGFLLDLDCPTGLSGDGDNCAMGSRPSRLCRRATVDALAASEDKDALSASIDESEACIVGVVWRSPKARAEVCNHQSISTTSLLMEMLEMHVHSLPR